MSAGDRPDFDFLERTYDHIAAHPETWAQDSWRCETGMCFAGTMADLHPGVEYQSDRSARSPTR